MKMLRNHSISILTGDTPREQTKKKSFLCKEHGKKIKLFCKDCKKTLCTVCCSVDHRACKDVVTIQAMLPQVKQVLTDQQKTNTDKSEATSRDIGEFNKKMDVTAAESDKVKMKIKQAFKETAEVLKRKQDQLSEKVDAIQEGRMQKLSVKIKSKELTGQKYQQKYQFIQEVLNREDESELYEIYLPRGSDVSDTDSDESNDAGDIIFIQNSEKLREDIDAMDIKTVKDAIDLSVKPIDRIDVKFDGEMSGLRDIVVLSYNGTNIIAVSDHDNNCIKSVYFKGRERSSSTLPVENKPWSIAVLNQTTLLVSSGESNEILTVGVNPDLTLLSTITTRKRYHGLAVLDKSKLVAGSDSPPSVDLLDMKGNITRSFTTLTSLQTSFKRPQYIHVTHKGNILVSDAGLQSVISMSQTGEVVFHYPPIGDTELKSPRGITSTNAGDFLLADYHKIIHLSTSGHFVECFHDQPYGISVHGDKLYVATLDKEVKIFRLHES